MAAGQYVGTIEQIQLPNGDVYSIHEEATTTTAGLMSAADKVKLNGIAAGAEVNEDEIFTATYGVTTRAEISDAIQNGGYKLILVSGGPGNSQPAVYSNINSYGFHFIKFNGTQTLTLTCGDEWSYTTSNLAPQDSPAFTGTPTAPTPATSVDNTQIATTAFVHDVVADQNAFADVLVGSTRVSADQSEDTLTLTAGSNITLTPDTTTKAVTIAAAIAAMPGVMQMYAGPMTSQSDAPDGWLWCNGEPVSRTTYASLFAVIGTHYGAGDGSTTFNLPDLRGRVAIGSGTGTNAAGTTNLTPRTLGDKIGGEGEVYTPEGENAAVTLTADQSGVPAHGHGMAHTHSHNHISSGYRSGYAQSGSNRATPVAYNSSDRSGQYTSDTDATAASKTTTDNNTAKNATKSHNHTFTGTSATLSHIQPSTVVNYIICTGL